VLKISSSFDSGAIEVVRLDDPADIRLRLRKDNAADFHQWFHFRLMGAAGKPVRMVFENAAGAAYPDGWRDYRCVASYDRQNWFRIAGTRYEDGQLIVGHTPERDSLYYAYFEPYSHERHLDLLARVELSPYARVRNLGSTVDGRDLDVVTVGRDAPGRVPVWIIARQHPGETMAEWFVEGLLERLLDNADPVARKVREHAVLHIVPNMNPDGAVRGNLRTNAAGANLNREWLNPSLETSPEVYHVRNKMLETGVDLFLDIHGDETIPYIFVAGTEGVPSYSPRIAALEESFKQQLKVASPDFQDEHGYDRDEPGAANLSMATAWVGNQFQCLAYTLEMPFKDNDNLPDDDTGWNGQRSLRLGEATLSAIYGVLKDLR